MPARSDCRVCGAAVPAGSLACPACGAPQGPDERKLVTVLFADLTGYTALSARMDPEEVHTLLAPVLGRLRLLIEAHGGSVPKVMGDGLLGVFGVPVAHEDDAERAVRAALALRDHVDERRRRGGSAATPRVHSGVNTGEVLVVGSREAAGFDVVGDVVNIASRLSGVAKAGEVIVGAATRALTAHAVRYGRRRLRPVKGKEGVEMYAALGVRSPEPAGRERRASLPFLDRREARARLGAELRAIRRGGRSRIVIVEGEPGIGKSRLAEETRALASGVTWLDGRCPPYGEHLPLFAIADAVRELLELDAGTEDAELARRAARLTRGPIGPITWQVRALTGTHDRAGGTLGSSQGTATAARSVIEALARRRPVVVALDDLQWGDLDLLELLARAHDEPWSARVLFLGMVRREPPPELRGMPTITLGSLPDADMRSIAEAVAGGELPLEVTRRLLERADGNPLFLEEGARMLVESGALRARGGRWELIEPEGLDRVPDTLHALVAARIDGLELDEKATLQTAAVSGDVTWLGLLERLSPPGTNAADATRRLRARDLLVPGDAPGSLRFKHRLIREVAERSLTKTARAARHAEVAAWLRTQPTEDVPALAHHTEAAWRLGAPDDAAARAAHAAHYLNRWGAMAFAHQPLLAERIFTRAEAASRAATDDGALAEASIGRAESLIELGRHAEAEREARRGRTIARRLQRDDLRARALMALGRAASDRGEVRRARVWLDEARQLFEAQGDTLGIAWTLQRLSEAERFGDLPTQVSLLDEALEAFERVDDVVGRAMVSQDLAYLLSVAGGSAYREAFRRANDLANAEGDPRSKAAILRTRAYHAYYSRRYATAIRSAQAARPLAHDAGDRWIEVDSLLVEALAAGAEGPPQQAEALARRVIRIAGDNDVRHLRAMGRLAGVRPAAARGNTALARRRLNEARTILDELGVTVEKAELDLMDAELQLRAGHPERAEPPARRAEVVSREGGWLLLAANARALLREARRPA